MSVKAGRHRFLTLAATAVVAGAFLLTAVACTPQQAMEMNLALGLNQMRADNSLPPLTIDASLSEVARYRAEDMAANDYFCHAPPDGCDYRCLFQKNGISMAWSGEVIAWNTTRSKDTVRVTIQMWRDSPGHFSVITNRCFTRMGTGAAVANGRADLSRGGIRGIGAWLLSHPALDAVTAGFDSHFSPVEVLGPSAGESVSALVLMPRLFFRRTFV